MSIALSIFLYLFVYFLTIIFHSVWFLSFSSSSIIFISSIFFNFSLSVCVVLLYPVSSTVWLNNIRCYYFSQASGFNLGSWRHTRDASSSTTALPTRILCLFISPLIDPKKHTDSSIPISDISLVILFPIGLSFVLKIVVVLSPFLPRILLASLARHVSPTHKRNNAEIHRKATDRFFLVVLYCQDVVSCYWIS